MRRLALAAAVFLAALSSAGGQEPERGKVRSGTASRQTLRAPADDDAFSFVIFGDRTTGPDVGLDVLRDAVTMTNRLDPALVMTVGDLVQGYTTAAKWVRQMRRYKGIMSALRMPWYPVAGNHDVYARPRRPGGHTSLYTQHFGPLYYSFDYKWAHFVVLFTDEGLAFNNPAKTQNMSAEQLEWLRKDLSATKAKQVFVFQHHPRWTPRYKGSNWDAVHRVLAADGRVEGVFGGHIHIYRDDGERDGIRYITLATTGGKKADAWQPSVAFDHVNLVVVRRQRVAMSVIPVGSVLGPDAVRGEDVDAMAKLLRGDWLRVVGAPGQAAERVHESAFAIELTNPTAQPLRVSASITRPEGWTFSHPPLEVRLQAGETQEIQVQARAEPLARTRARAPRLEARLSYGLPGGRRQPIAVRRRLAVAQVDLSDWASRQRGANQVLLLDGKSAVRVPSAAFDGLEQFTLELWVRGPSPEGRRGLATKTESSALGFFWSDTGDSRPSGMVHLRGSGYLSVSPPKPWLWGRWTHLALSYDGETLRLFVGGQGVDSKVRRGEITPNPHPFYVGADPNRRGEPGSFFQGAVDELRISSVARYAADFDPPSALVADPQTRVLLHFDATLGGFHPDASGRGHHGESAGPSGPRLGRERSWN